MLDWNLIWIYIVSMINKKSKKQPLKQEHFEIILEDIQDKFQFLIDGHTTLNEKVDHLGDEIKATRDELHSTREELIFLMKASIDKSEERLTRKIENGDKKVMNYTDRKTQEVINFTDKKAQELMHNTDRKTQEVMNYTDQKSQELMKYTDKKIKLVMEHTDRKIEEVKDILKIHSGQLDAHEERIIKPEQKNRA